jgi:hypothetical protein
MKEKFVMRKLLVVVRAGASVEFDMPSVERVGEILSAAAQHHFSLLSNDNTNLYCYFTEMVADYRKETVASHLNKKPNFEDILYAIYSLG